MVINILKSTSFAILVIFTTAFYFMQVQLIRFVNFLTSKKDISSKVHLVASRWGRAVFNLVPGWKVTIIDQQNLPKPGEACVIVANHESATDIFAIYFLGVQFRWLSKDAMFKYPMFGSAMRAAGYISITRGDKESHRLALEASARCLKSKISMLFFPEGTRSTAGQPKEFKIGAFKLAAECDVPILPVVLYGAGRLLKKGTLAPNRAELKIKVLPRLKINANESVQDFTKRVENLIRSEHVRLSSNE